jgi:hypothetical protein
MSELKEQGQRDGPPGVSQRISCAGTLVLHVKGAVRIEQAMSVLQGRGLGSGPGRAVHQLCWRLSWDWRQLCSRQQQTEM